MNGGWRLWALAAAIGLQLLVLAGELIGAAYPLWIGREVRLQVEPVDPRSLFRGNYARLDYEIGAVPVSQQKIEQGLRRGEVVYVGLEEDAKGVMRATEVSLDEPDSGPFIRGRIDRVDSRGQELTLRFGTEAYFLPREKALALESELRREKAIAVVKLAPNGKAALVEVETESAAD